MTTASTAKPASRAPLSRERVFEAAVAFADEHGIEELSMRKLGGELGVEAMSLYYHVANKEEDPRRHGRPRHRGDRHPARGRRLEGHPPRADLRRAADHERHPWAPEVIESRSRHVVRSDALHGRHRRPAAAGRLLGGSHAPLDARAGQPCARLQPGALRRLRLGRGRPGGGAGLPQAGDLQFPNIASILEEIQHQEASIVGSGCDDDIEFGFALDILLDGLERKRDEEQVRVAQL